MMILKGENTTRDRAVFEVTYTFRAPLPQQEDARGNGLPQQYESGITRVNKYILAPSLALAEAAARHLWGDSKDFEVRDVYISAFQLDAMIDTPIYGGRI